MTTNIKGNIGLANVLLNLTEKGYYSFIPFTDTTCVDLIVCNEKMKTQRFQIKHRKITNGCIKVKCVSVINGKDVLIDKSKIDYFAVYCPDNKSIYYLPITIFSNTNCVTLRINEPKFVNKKIHYGIDYLSFAF